MRAEMKADRRPSRVHYVKKVPRARGRHRDVNGGVPPMFMFRLLSAARRGCAAFALGLVILVGLPGDVLAADTQVSIVQPSDTMSWRYDPSSLSISAGS